MEPVTHTSWWSSERDGTMLDVEVLVDGKWEPAEDLEPGVRYTLRVRARNIYRPIPERIVRVTLT